MVTNRVLRSTVLLCASLASSTALFGKDWYVEDSDFRCDRKDGSQQKPFCTIQEAVDHAQSGDRIFIAKGSYPEEVLVDNLALELIGETTNATHVTRLRFSQASVLVRGLWCGALLASASLVELTEVRVRDGRGITVSGSSLTCIDVEILDNVKEEGAGVYASSSDLYFERTVIARNIAHDDYYGQERGRAGAIYIPPRSTSSTLVMVDCLVEQNRTGYFYGGFSSIEATVGSSLIERTRFQGNDWFSLFLEAEGGDVVLRACEMYSDGSFIARSNGGTADVSNCTIVHADLVVPYHDCIVYTCEARNAPLSLGHNCYVLAGDCTAADLPPTDLLGVDPRFVNESKADFRLQADSPCVDSGDPHLLRTGFDFSGSPRQLDGTLTGSQVVDRGAHEFANVDLTVLGNPTPGGSLRFLTEGTAGLCAFLFVGTAYLESSLPPYGPIFLDPSYPWFFRFHSLVPDDRTLQIPSDLPVPAPFVLQLLAMNAQRWGNFSSPVSIVIE